jgi:hypothetical protein
MTPTTRRDAIIRGGSALSFLATLLMSAPAAFAQEKKMTSLFKIITVRDEIVIGLDQAELGRLGGKDAGAVAKALKSEGTLTAWQYAAKKADNGDLQQAPMRKVGLIGHDTLRVEPYATPLAVLPHE